MEHELVLHVAVLNAGSSTMKGAVIEVGPTSAVTRSRISGTLTLGSDPKEVLNEVLEQLLGTGIRIDAVGHRIVHGGDEFMSTTRLEPSVEQKLESLVHLAPLHNPIALAAIRGVRERMPLCPQIAVFDTAFHAGRKPESLRYALPWDLCEEFGLHRYGFHGIAHQAMSESLADARGVEPSEVVAVTLQLGSGCSACAVEGGRSIETSMGVSAFGGLPMATRSGDLDPGVMLTLLRHGWGAEGLERLLTRGSGLYGLTGLSDMRDVLRAEAEGDDRAALAVAHFVRSLVSTIGAYLTLLRGEGAIVFGGGIGAGSIEIRERVADGLVAWNVALDPDRNRSIQDGCVSREGMRPVYVFETDEERLIARETYHLLQGRSA